MKHLLGRPKTVRSALLRLLPAVVVVSAFMNNTPVTALLAPAVIAWANSCGLPPTQLLMPLRYPPTHAARTPHARLHARDRAHTP